MCTKLYPENYMISTEDESICTMSIDLLVDTDWFCGKLFILFALQVILYN